MGSRALTAAIISFLDGAGRESGESMYDFMRLSVCFSSSGVRIWPERRRKASDFRRAKASCDGESIGGRAVVSDETFDIM